MPFTSGNPALWKNLLKLFLVLVSSLRWLFGRAHNIIHTAVHCLICETIFIRVVIIKWHNIAEPNKFVKCDFILHLKKKPRLLAVKSSQPQIMSQKS